jgi:hypothetical protein
MIRWLSQLWISTATDRDGKPPRLWRLTFGRFASHRGLASRMDKLDDQLKRQAASQHRLMSREHMQIGLYSPRMTRTRVVPDVRSDGPFSGASGWLRPTLAAGSLAMVVAAVWITWPTAPSVSPREISTITANSFAKAWDPFARQVEMTGRALRTQTTQVTQLPQRLPPINQVVNDLGEAIQTPIRDEIQRFAEDLRQPWIYLAGQLPRLPQDGEADPLDDQAAPLKASGSV